MVSSIPSHIAFSRARIMEVSLTAGHDTIGCMPNHIALTIVFERNHIMVVAIACCRIMVGQNTVTSLPYHVIWIVSRILKLDYIIRSDTTSVYRVMWGAILSISGFPSTRSSRSIRLFEYDFLPISAFRDDITTIGNPHHRAGTIRCCRAVGEQYVSTT